MKIAVITDDGTTISQHFGRAPLYSVVTVEDGKTTGKEQRAKAGHNTFAGAGEHHEHHGHGHECSCGEKHGYDAGAQERHRGMFAAISDCDVLITGGMGWGAYEGAQGAGLKTIVTDVKDIDEAVSLYIEDKLSNLMDRLH